jgi:hypothetical protein
MCRRTWLSKASQEIREQSGDEEVSSSDDGTSESGEDGDK